MKIVENKTFDEERALYGSVDTVIRNCKFDGPADGESAVKECKNVEIEDSYLNLRYPLWHVDGLKISGSELTENCRAALWYSNDVEIKNTKLHGIKAARECGNVSVYDCDVISAEFGWFCKNLKMENVTVEGQYFILQSSQLQFKNVTLNGKYSLQYITDSVFEDCNFVTRGAFWHAKNIVVRNSVLQGEYLAWYSENVTFEHCKIIGTQPLCYCKGLKLIDCEMINTDLSFEKSEVEATLTAPILSIKNPLSGVIKVPSAEEVIFDDENAKGKVIYN